MSFDLPKAYTQITIYRKGFPVLIGWGVISASCIMMRKGSDLKGPIEVDIRGYAKKSGAESKVRFDAEII